MISKTNGDADTSVSEIHVGNNIVTMQNQTPSEPHHAGVEKRKQKRKHRDPDVKKGIEQKRKTKIANMHKNITY